MSHVLDTPPERVEPCPACSADVVFDGRHVPWCPACAWGLRAPEPEPPRGRVDRALAAAGRRQGDLVLEEVLGQDALRPRPTPATVAAAALAVAVLAGTAALGAGGVLLILRGVTTNPFAVAVGILMVLVAALARPRLGRMPDEGVLRREQALTLHALIDEVAARLDVRAPDVVVIDARFNGSWSVVGLRRRRVLTLGLPLWIALGPQERVALLAHELAHERNGDLSRGLLIGASLDALAALHTTLAPDHDDHASWEHWYGPLGELTSAVTAVLALPVRGLLWVQSALLLRDRQRAEYLADALAADVAGTDAEIASQEAMLLGPLLTAAVQRRAVDPRTSSEGLVAELRATLAAVPERERERRRRVARLETTRLAATHPPTGRRLAFQERRGHREPAVALDAARNARVDAELAPLEDPTGHALVDAWRGGRL